MTANNRAIPLCQPCLHKLICEIEIEILPIEYDMNTTSCALCRVAADGGYVSRESAIRQAELLLAKLRATDGEIYVDASHRGDIVFSVVE